jgi:hypothetical protein
MKKTLLSHYPDRELNTIPVNLLLQSNTKFACSLFLSSIQLICDGEQEQGQAISLLPYCFSYQLLTTSIQERSGIIFFKLDSIEGLTN